jgi:hypothetical protein
MGLTIYINAWDGPWGWRQAFYDWVRNNPDKAYGFDLTNDITQADVVFNADISNWRALEKCSRHARIICNVLDFGEWKGEWDQSVHEYVETMKPRASRWTAISDKVIAQLEEHYDVAADMFYYPSQIEAEFGKLTRPGAKKIFTTFARLGDPGKAIRASVEAFNDSKLADDGWKYRLVGPEAPPFKTEGMPGVFYMGYIPDVASLIMMVSQSAYVVMPSYGEGLGLPAIEGMLLARPFIAREIEPARSIFNKIWDPACSFKDDDGITQAMINAANDFKSENYMHKTSYGYGIAHLWLRDTAFSALAQYLRRC